MAECFGASKKKAGECRVLAVEGCIGILCPFRKSVAQHKADRARANARLRGLSETDQSWIADKYHKGKRPWAK